MADQSGKEAAEVATKQTSDEKAAWGTSKMGAPASPSAHPTNQHAAAYLKPRSCDDPHSHYVLEHEPVAKPGGNPMMTIYDVFDSWAKKTETLATNVWHHLQVAPSKSEVVWDKLSLTAKAISEGGFEPFFKRTFPTEPNEKLNKTFACYLSTTTGPVAGTLFLSSVKVVFCSDRPLSFTSPSGDHVWSYYKLVIPLDKIASVSPTIRRENPPEKYIQIATVDGKEFWLMGFVSYDKAYTALLNEVQDNNEVPDHAAAVSRHTPHTDLLDDVRHTPHTALLHEIPEVPGNKEVHEIPDIKTAVPRPTLQASPMPQGTVSK